MGGLRTASFLYRFPREPPLRNLAFWWLTDHRLSGMVPSGLTHAYAEKQMKTLIGIIAALAAAASSRPAHSQSFKFTCAGTGSSQGNEGMRALGKTTYRIDGEGQQISIRDGGHAFCMQGASCTVAISAEFIQVVARSVPQHDPGYSATFQLYRKSLTFKAFGGGLDGGWTITGKCKAEHA